LACIRLAGAILFSGRYFIKVITVIMAKKQKKSDLKAWGSQGGKTTLKKHGSTHFSKAAKLKWEKERQKKEQ
jgi:hypothetical protein